MHVCTIIRLRQDYFIYDDDSKVYSGEALLIINFSCTLKDLKVSNKQGTISLPSLSMHPQILLVK